MSDEMPSGIAIVGMSGRFPGANSVEAFWENICEGKETVTRFDASELEISQPEGADYVCAKGMLDNVDMFDARFFGYLPREAEVMDPQHRMFLEICWEAMEHAGYDSSRYDGAVGVYAGCYMDTYVLHNLCSDESFRHNLVESIQVGTLQTELGNDKDYLATRVAFKMGLTGPAMTLQTACSTSLVAIATACQSLETYGCDMALAGGVTIVLPQYKGYAYKEGGMLSPDGRCRPFDANAAGTVFSNGAAVLLLKRVEDAIADGDTIYAVIKGYATNNDGATKLSYTAPSVDGQAEVISTALGMAEIDARTVGYVEAHGTATPLGDPIEIAGLTTAYRNDTQDTEYCAIGSVKANLGHLDIASGAIGLIKTSLLIHNNYIPPLTHFKEPNPNIDFKSSPFFVPTAASDWSHVEGPRRAGVSSFGVGGTNAHVVMEEAPHSQSEACKPNSHQLMCLSAKSESALDTMSSQIADHLEKHPDVDLANIAYTLQVGRKQFEHRRAIVVPSNQQSVIDILRSDDSEQYSNGVANRLVFLYPGQATQYPGMGRDLYENFEVCRATIDNIAGYVRDENPDIGDIRELICWDEDSTLSLDDATHRIEQTAAAQPIIFAVSVAVTELLKTWGVSPSATLGHSVGEFAALTAAGVYGLEDAARLVTVRAKLMQEQPTGSMLAVRASVEEVQKNLPSQLSVATINSPGVTVVSGPSADIDQYEASLSNSDQPPVRLRTSHAFHSPMMDPAITPLNERAASIEIHDAQCDVISSCTGQNYDFQRLNNSYWGDQLVSPVQFVDALQKVGTDYPDAVILEVGAGQVLSSLAAQILDEEFFNRIVSSMGNPKEKKDDHVEILSAVGRLWTRGIDVDWPSLHNDQRQRIALPTYPFERKRYWVEPTNNKAAQREKPIQQSQPKNEPSTMTQKVVAQQLDIISAQLNALKTRRGQR